MASAEIRRTISSIGYAKVIAVLNASETAASVDEMADSSSPNNIEKNFIVPDLPQFESLAATAQEMSSRAGKGRPRDIPKMRIFPKLGLALGYVDKNGASALTKDPRVSDVVKAPEFSLIRPVTSSAAADAAPADWGIRQLKIDKIWERGYDGSGVLIGHLDTGVDADHPDLQGQIQSFAEFDFAGDLVRGATPYDSGTHGTHTAGTLVGKKGDRGAYGVAPGAKLASGMVIEGGLHIDRILNGLEWVAERNCRVLSMSLGLRGYEPSFEVVITALRRLNILPVIAVGNEYANTSRSPGNYINVLSVGASNKDNEVANFSSSQRFLRSKEPLVPDLVAPGVDTFSCLPGGGYGVKSGSSMATPHIAGLAALLMQAKPDATAGEVESAILQSCRLPATMPVERANRGIPDGLQALQLLIGNAAAAAAVNVKRRAPRDRAA